MAAVAVVNNGPSVDRVKCDPTAYGNDDQWAQMSAPASGGHLRSVADASSSIGSAFTNEQRALLDFPDTMATLTLSPHN